MIFSHAVRVPIFSLRTVQSLVYKQIGSLMASLVDCWIEISAFWMFQMPFRISLKYSLRISKHPFQISSERSKNFSRGDLIQESLDHQTNFIPLRYGHSIVAQKVRFTHCLCDSLRWLQGAGFPISLLSLKRARVWQKTNFQRVKNEILKELTYSKFNQKLDLGFERMNLFA